MIQKTSRYVLFFLLLISVGFASIANAQESAEPEGATTAATETTNEASPFGGMIYMLPLIALMVLMMFTMRPGQKDQAKRDEMLKMLKKNDRVVTAGGIVAKVSSINSELKTVKLLLDEKSGSSMTVTIAAISRLIKDDEDVNDEGKA